MSETLLRNKGKNVLSHYLDKEKNIEIIEKNIYNYIVEKGKDSFEENYLNILYEICYELQEKELKVVNEALKKGNVLWESLDFEDEKKKQEEKDNFLTNPFDVEEGIEKCGKCGSGKTYSISKQVRAADEGFSTFSHCLNCHNRWRNN